MKQYLIYENPYAAVKVSKNTKFQLHRLDISKSDVGPFLTSFSPFVVKLECYLRMFNVPYEVLVERPSFNQAPRGKLPYVSVGDTKLTDSDLVISYLKKTQGNPDADLDATQRALGHLVQRALGDHLYWVIIYYEFFDQNGWDILLKANVGDPSTLSLEAQVALAEIREDFRKRCYDQGIARYSPHEIFDKACKDIDAVSDILGDNRYLLGNDHPTSFDAVLLGFMQAIFQVRNMHPDITDYARSIPKLGRYMQNMTAAYFPELRLAFEPT